MYYRILNNHNRRTSVSKDKWEKLEGTFKLSDDKPDRVVFYIEGPDPGVDLLVESVLVSCATSQVSSVFSNLFFEYKNCTSPQIIAEK